MNGALLTVFSALLLTVLIETSLAALLGVRDRSDLLLVALVNCITNPAVNLLAAACATFAAARGVFIAATAAAEVAVILAEGCFFRRFIAPGRVGPFWLSLILNAVSGVGGSLLLALF